MPIDPRDVAFLSLALLVDYGRTYAQVKTERAEKLRTASEVIAEALARASGATCPKRQPTANAHDATSGHGSTSAEEGTSGHGSTSAEERTSGHGSASEGQGSQPTDRIDDAPTHATEPEADAPPTATATDEPEADAPPLQDAPVFEASTSDSVPDSAADQEGRGAPVEDLLCRPETPTQDPADAAGDEPTATLTCDLADTSSALSDAGPVVPHSPISPTIAADGSGSPVEEPASVASPSASATLAPQPTRLAETIPADPAAVASLTTSMPIVRPPTRLAEVIADDHAAVASPGVSTSPAPQPIRLAETIARALAPLHPLGTPATPPPPLDLSALASRRDYALTQRLVFAEAASRVTARALVANRNNLAASRADTDNLRRDLAARQAELAALRAENDTLRTENATLRAENLALRHLEAEVDRLAQRVDTTVAFVHTRIASRPTRPLAAPALTPSSSLFAEPRDRLDLTVLHALATPHALTPLASAPPHGPAPPHAHAQAPPPPPPPPPPQPTRGSPPRKRSRRPALASLALLSLLDTPPLPAT